MSTEDSIRQDELPVPPTDPGPPMHAAAPMNPGAVSAERAVDARGPRRLHPSSLLFNIGRYGFSLLLPGLLVIFFAVGDREDTWFMWAFVPALLVSVLRYATLRYELRGTELVVREGLVFRATRHIPYGRIQNVDTVQNPFHRLLGVATVRVETAAGKEPEAVLQVVSMREVEEIRRGVHALRGVVQGELAGSASAAPADASSALPLAGAEAEAEANAGRAFFRMGAGDVLLFGLLSQRGMAYLSGAFYLAWEFSLFDRLDVKIGRNSQEMLREWAASFAVPSALVWAGLALALLGLLQILTTVWAFVTLHGFELSRHREDLRSVCGLWTHQTATLPRHRIQRLTLREGWILRRLGRGSLRVTSAGADSTEGKQITRRWLVPVAHRAELLRVLEQVQPEVSFEREDWQPVHPRARKRIFSRLALIGLLVNLVLVGSLGPRVLLAFPLWVAVAFVLARTRARRLGWRLDRNAIVVRDGWFAEERTAVRFSKVQSVALVRSPFDRRRGMASVRVATAGGSATTGAVVIPYLALRTARSLTGRLKRQVAEVEFRW